MSFMKNYFKSLEFVAKVWQIQLNMEFISPKKNVRLAFKDIGSFGEFLALDFYDGFMGTGSGGMGYDLQNLTTKKAIEVKTCCTIQNSNCNNCKSKFNPIFSTHCPFCNSEDIKNFTDSRFGINSDEILRQIENNILENLTLCHLSLLNVDEKSVDILLRWYVVDFKDSKLLNEQLLYFKKQSGLGKKPHNNLLPESFDFFKLCPRLINETKIKIFYKNLEQDSKIEIEEKNEFIRVPEKVLNKGSERELFEKLETYDIKSKTASCLEFTLKIGYRKKTHGKNRGDTRKNLDTKLKG